MPLFKSSGPVISDWTAFTPTGSWSSNTTYVGQWRRVGDTSEVQITISLSGAPTSAALTVNMPSGQTIDTTKIAGGGSTANFTLGILSCLDSGNNNYPGYVVYSTTGTVGAVYITSSDVFANVTQAAPVTFGNADGVFIAFRVPIVGWTAN